MKYFVILFLLSTFSGFGQVRTKSTTPKPTFSIEKISEGICIRNIAMSSFFSLIAGSAWGFHEGTQHHWSKFQKKFPDANPNYWNPEISWKNKYRNGNPEEGEKFYGSSTVFVAITDAKHLLSFIHRGSLIGTGICLTIGEKKPLKHYLIGGVANAISFGIGFTFAYDWIYKL